jgi:hypothetical protein
VSTLFTIAGKQIIRTRPAYRGQVETGDGDLPSIDQLEAALEGADSAEEGGKPPYWQRWQNKFDYLYIVYSHKGAPNPFPEWLTPIYDSDHFQLYRIAQPGAAGPPAR